ncbi:MAG: aminotransferase class V-fold PLP-dependent enzyme [Armatimonadetes bacterium]|nr:aminotransferase class V-fold PLP-dependent enzyme [Armatimonadota bacterium]
MVSGLPTADLVRAHFPALESGFVFLENAGGSQMPECVMDAMSSFVRESYVQTTAGYPASDRATETARQAHEMAELLMGAEGKGSVVLGASTTQLVCMLAECYSRYLLPGDEVIVSIANHEANAGPWSRLERFGAVVKWWGVDPYAGEMRLSDLEKLLTKRTKIVAFPHTSNLLGNIVDVAAVAKLVHEVGGRVVIDGVAYASHGYMEVADWDVDFYAYSTYKVYGPHMAALYGKHEAWSELDGPNHFFVAKEEIPRKFELGSLPYEGCAGLVALGDYLRAISGRLPLDRQTVEAATGHMRLLEAPVTKKLLDYLTHKPGVRVVGPIGQDRVPTVSFVSDRVPSPAVSSYVNERGFGIRHGHMYSHRLTEALGVDTGTGFVRVSAVHYNTVDEIERLCGVLDEVL